ncbi:MAG: hypothetical protein FDZ70_07745 [Actinobacteria bacterium]|nr:MAG: hypothetical protein FDZ70_07745 [Actinomycetota bacterium]
MADPDDSAPGAGGPAPQSEAGQAAVPPSPRRVITLHVPWKSILAVGVLIAFGLPVYFMLQPGTYERYPDLKSRMDDWRTSTHARIACADCHVDPGVKGFLAFAAKAGPAFYSQIVNGPRSENLLNAPSRAACQKCHTGYREVSSDGDLLIPHKAHVEVLDMNCVRCHQDLVHSKNEHGFNRPQMEMCLKACHDGTQATRECVKCHTRKQAPADHKRGDWLEVHSAMATKTDCDECHSWSPDYCKDCHLERPESHTATWKKDHQHRAKERGKGCYACHDSAKFCKQCHD